MLARSSPMDARVEAREPCRLARIRSSGWATSVSLAVAEGSSRLAAGLSTAALFDLRGQHGFQAQKLKALSSALTDLQYSRV